MASLGSEVVEALTEDDLAIAELDAGDADGGGAGESRHSAQTFTLRVQGRTERTPFEGPGKTAAPRTILSRIGGQPHVPD